MVDLPREAPLHKGLPSEPATTTRAHFSGGGGPSACGSGYDKVVLYAFWDWRTGVSDRGEVPDLSVSGDNFDLVGGDPHDPTTTSETRSANAIAEPTPDGYQPC
jgi:hypothetical protein